MRLPAELGNPGSRCVPGARYRFRARFRAYRSMLAPPPGTLLRFDEPLDILGETTYAFDAMRYRFETMDQPPYEVKLYEIEGLEFSGDPVGHLETTHFRVHPEIQEAIDNVYLEESGLAAPQPKRP